MKLALLCLIALVALSGRCQGVVERASVCNTCEWAVQTSENWLKTPQALEFLTEVLQDNACTELPKDSQTQCKLVVPLVLPTVISILESWTPREVCEDVALCVSPKDTAMQLKLAMADALSGGDNGVPCPICQLAVSTIKAQLSDPENQKFIWDSANQICAAIPIPTLSANCTAILAEKLPKFFDLVKDLDPNGICVDILHACPPRPPPGEIAVPLSSAKKLPPNLARLSASIDKTLKAELGSNCDTCKAVITEAALLLSNPDTQKEILDIAKNACTAFQQYKDQCVTYLELYGPLLFNMVVQYLQPQLCITLGYCSTGHMQKFLPGATLMVS